MRRQPYKPAQEEEMSKHITVSALIGTGLIVAACGTPATPTAVPTKAPAAPTNAPAPTAVPQPTQAAATKAPAAPTTAPAPSAAPAATATKAAAAPAAETITLKIVPGESKANYEVGEVFINRNNTLAVAIGITDKVNGEIKLNTKDPSKTQVGKVEVNIEALASEGHPNGNGSARRDSFIRTQWLESSKYPVAEFSPTKLEGLPTTYKPGDTLKFKMTGDMKVHDTVKPVTWDVEAAFDGKALTGKATTALKMSMFNVSPPNIAGILKADDDTKLSIQIVAKP
jgi:polyisoprenoid-binding protein YceI